MRILFLVHRLPYPPNKGDKLRSFRELRSLAERHQVSEVLLSAPERVRHVRFVIAGMNPVREVKRVRRALAQEYGSDRLSEKLESVFAAAGAVPTAELRRSEAVMS